MILPKMRVRLKFFLCIISLLSMVVILNQSCKKIDSRNELNDQLFTERFFTPKNINNSTVNNIIKQLKIENEKTGFVNKLPKNIGFPIWEKALQKNKQVFSRENLGDSSSDLIVVPMTANNEDLSAVIIAVESVNGFIISTHTTNDELYALAKNPSPFIHPEAEKFLGLFMFMENYTFGTSKFHQIPRYLFPGIAGDTSPNNTKSVEIAAIEPATTTSGFMGMACWLVQSPLSCNCADPTQCDWRSGCSTCSAIYCEPVGGGGGGCTSCGPGGNPTTGSGGQPGGAGGNGGGTTDPPTYPTGTSCTQLEKAWYNYIIMPTNPCDPVQPPAEPDVILDPCPKATALASDQVFINMMENLKSHCNNTTDHREYGWLYQYTNPLTLFDLPPGPVGQKEINLTIMQPIDGIGHNHFENSLSIFTPLDLWSLCNVFNDGNILNNSTFTLSLVTAQGTQYLLMIENLTQFRAFVTKYLSGDLDGNRHAYSSIYKISETTTNENNEKHFLQYLKGCNAGLKLFKGNATFTHWTPLGLDANNNVATVPCP